MTIVLWVATREHVYMASDRRITSFAPPHKPLQSQNKAALVEGRLAFAYSGRSHIGDEPTDSWLVRVIASGSTRTYIEIAERIATEATAAFEKLKVPSAQKRHVFQAVGWFPSGPNRTLTPGILAITNALKPDWSWKDDADAKFMCRDFLMPNLPPTKQPFIASAGQSLTRPEVRAIGRHIHRCANNRNASQNAVTCALAQSILWLSRRYSSIGDEVTTVRIPKAAVIRSLGSGPIELSTLAGPDNCSFAYFAKGRPAQRFGPAFVGRGFAAVGMMMQTGKPPSSPG